MRWSEICDIIYATYPQGAKLDLQVYTYPLSIAGLAASQTSNQVLDIAANANFFITQPLYHAWIDDTKPDVIPLCSLLISDTGSNQQFSSSQVDFTTFFGSYGTADSLMQYPRMVNGKSGLAVSVTNVSTALTYNINMSFGGVLVRQYGT